MHNARTLIIKMNQIDRVKVRSDIGEMAFYGILSSNSACAGVFRSDDQNVTTKRTRSATAGENFTRDHWENWPCSTFCTIFSAAQYE